MLKIVVYVNESEVARAHLGNISELADLSDYEIQMNERASERLGIKEKSIRGEILQHRRKQTVWSLVQKAAQLWMEKTGAREPRAEMDELTTAFLKLKKVEFLAGRAPLFDPISSPDDFDELIADVEIDPLTRALLALQAAEIALGHARLSDPVSADEIRARKVNESDNELLSQIRASIRELDDLIADEENGNDEDN